MAPDEGEGTGGEDPSIEDVSEPQGAGTGSTPADPEDPDVAAEDLPDGDRRPGWSQQRERLRERVSDSVARMREQAAAMEARRAAALGVGPPPEPMAEEGDELVAPHDDRPDTRRLLRRPLTQRPTVRAGVYAWSAIGVAIVVIALAFGVARLSSVIIPLVVALFPAAVLYPLTRRLKDMGVPSGAAAAIVLVVTLGIVGGVGAVIAPLLADQLGDLSDTVREGFDQVDRFLASGPFGLEPIRLDDLIDQVTEGLQSSMGGAAAGNAALGVAVALFSGATSVLLTLIVLFFYLKDGPSIGSWIRSLFPTALHGDVERVGDIMWRTIGGYIQGQLIVAFVDAVFIGLGLWILGVPLAVPLAVIVFFGGLFPIVGATLSGMLAALVALATNGVVTAVLVVGVVLLVQGLEGNLLQPLILGRALELHPMAIIIALATGGFLLGILGAFLAVPVAAAGARTVGYIRERVPG